MVRAVVGGVCLMGVIACAFLKQRTKAVEPAIDPSVPSLPPQTRAISVTYRNTLEAARRCELYTLLNKKVNLLIFAFIGMIGAIMAANQIVRFNPSLSLLLLPVFHLLAFWAFLAYIAFIHLVLVRAKFPRRDSVRVCTTSLSADGFQDVTPDKIIPIPWQKVHQIREVAGDVYVWTITGGCYIPRSAFESLDAARRYHRAAVTLWQSRGTEWPDDVPDLIDENHRSAPAWAANDDNPYAPPRAPIHFERDSTRHSIYRTLIIWTAGMIALEYLVVIPIILRR
jgi:hypothetical protein